MTSGELAASLVLAAAALATPARAEPQALIDRPLLLAPGELQLSLRGDLADWSNGAGNPAPSGFALGGAADFGLTRRLQLGLALAGPIAPGNGFGSALLSASYSLRPELALRADAGYERISLPAEEEPYPTGHHGRVFFGFGLPLEWRLGDKVALISGRAGAGGFGPFVNIRGFPGQGFYWGSSASPGDGSELINVNFGVDPGNSNPGDDGDALPTWINLQLPAGLLLQPGRYVAFTVRTGYGALIATGMQPGFYSYPSHTWQFVPLGFDLMVSPLRQLDLGATVQLDFVFAGDSGYVGATAMDVTSLVTVWLRWRFELLPEQ